MTKTIDATRGIVAARTIGAVCAVASVFLMGDAEGMAYGFGLLAFGAAFLSAAAGKDEKDKELNETRVKNIKT